jgi:polysaccharide export outer membrane protein
MFTILVTYLSIIAQESSQDYNLNLKDQYSIQLPKSAQSLMSTGGLNSSVDEDEYIVDSGDIFLIKIDVAGPAINIFQSAITPDGSIFLPNTKSFKVNGMKLAEAKTKIIKALQISNPSSEIEVHLFQTHPIAVSILGAVKKEGKQQLTSSSRLFDLIQLANDDEFMAQKNTQNLPHENTTIFSPSKKYEFESSVDSLELSYENKISLRNIELIRGNKIFNYDLYRFKMLGDKTQNPYLMNDDIVKVPYREAEKNVIEVNGAVGSPISFEYLKEDNLYTALAFSGGILPSADSANIEIYRFSNNEKNYEKIVVNYESNLEYPLMPDDRIFVRYKPDYHQKFSVEIVGEVKFPGRYPILEGETTLKELITLSGGFTPNASLLTSKIIRRKIRPGENDLERLALMRANEMTEIERSYFQQRSREDLRVVKADFSSLFERNSGQNIRLRDKDIIFIPKKLSVIFVSGGVFNPGNIEYDSLKTIADYLNSAGGFVDRANKGKMKIIKAKTGNWIEVGLNDKPMPGDMIFVPLKRDRDNWSYIREGLTVAAQLGAIVAVIYSISK